MAIDKNKTARNDESVGHSNMIKNNTEQNETNFKEQ